jgi:hypothetical protein
MGPPRETENDVEIARRYFVGFEVPTAVNVGSIIILNITSYSAVEVQRRFGGTCYFHLEG